MKAKIKNYLMMNKKVHYKMYKSGKSWVVAGIATLGLSLAFSMSTASVRAMENSTTVSSTVLQADTNISSIWGKASRNDLAQDINPIFNTELDHSTQQSNSALNIVSQNMDEDHDYTPQNAFVWQYNADGTAYMKNFIGNQSIVNIPPTIVNPDDGKTYTVTRIDGNYGPSGWGSEAPRYATLNGLINNPNITSLTIPGTVKTLYAGTIGTLPNLVSFKLSEGVTTISQSIPEIGVGPNNFWEIFWNSRKLTYLYLPKSLTNFTDPLNIIDTLIGRSTSPLTRLTNVDYVFNNFKKLYAESMGANPSPLTDFTDVNYYIPDEEGYLDDPDIVQWLRADGSRLPVTMSDVQNATYDSNAHRFKIKPGKLSIKYHVTIDLSALNKPNQSLNITLPIFRGKIDVKDAHYSVGERVNLANNFERGTNADGGALNWNDPAVRAEVTDRQGNVVPIDQVTQAEGEYNIKYIYTYGFNQKTYTSKTAKITVKQSNNIKVSLVATNSNKKLVNEVTVDREHHTNDILDLGPNSEFINSVMPKGYHYATTDAELMGHVQPNNPSYGPNPQSLTVYIVGDEITENDKNSILVHYYLQKGNQKTTEKVKEDRRIGGRIGDVISVGLNDPQQVAPSGYELVPGQRSYSCELNPDGGHEISFYYTAKIQDNITIDFIDIATGESVAKSKPGGTHHTGDILDIKSEDVKSKVPNGYHIAEGDELGNKEQPDNPKYTNDPQTPKVWIIGDKVADDASNAVTIHHYLQKADGTKTTTPVPGLEDRHEGGRVGENRTFAPTAAPTGYTSVSQPVEWTFKVNEGKVINFYYTANDASNITVTFRNSRTDKDISTDRPQGVTGDVLDLSARSSYVAGKTPKGYHYSTPNELRNDQKQVTNLTFGVESQTTTVYLTPEKDTSIDVIFEDVTTGEKNKVKPENHYTGDELDLKHDEEITSKIPDGFHVAEPGELGEGQHQPTENPTYDTTHKEEKIYIIGDKIDDNATNAVTIHHYLQKPDGTKTTTKVPGLEDIHKGGRVGETKTFTPAAAPAGYTLKSQPVEWTFKANEGKVINFYYEANDASNITVKFRSSRTDKDITTDRPQGLTGDVLDLSATSSYVAGKTPKGYHYSTSNELRSNQKQATNLTFGLTPQTTTVYLTPEKDTSIEIILEDATTGEKIKVKPENHFTGDELDLKNDEEIKNKIPDGFHIAEPGELGEGKGQPTENPKYDTTHKEEKIYIIGDKIDKNATNAVTIHHYLQKSDGTKTTTKVPGLEDRHEGGRVGETKTFTPAAAPAGYTLKSEPVEWTFKVNDGKVINFYYEAGEQNNIKVHFINVKNGKELVTDNPVGTTGSVLDLAPTADYVQGMLNSKTELKGYHYATGRELNGQTQSKNPTYTTSEQHVNVFVAGDKVSGDNAVSVQHRLKENGQLTDKPVPGMRDFSKDGYVGDEFTFKTDDREQQAPRGYKLVDGQADQLRTLGLTAPDPVIFYYEAIEQNNVTVAFVNTETGAVVDTDKPSGAFGSTLDLTPNGSYLANKIPSGYHYAKRGELRSGQQQPRNLTYTTEDQTVRVYIAADVISDDSEDAVTIHHYVKGTNDKVVGLDDIKRGGRYGETVTFKKDAPEHLAPKGYKMSDDQTDLSWTFGQQGGDRNLIFNYEKVDLNNITVKYVNIKNNQVILTENPAGKIGEVLNLHIGEDLELPRELVSGYKYPTTDKLAGRTQANNPTYSSKDQEVTVYVTPKGFPTSAQMKIEYVNVNNSDDRNLSGIVWEVDLTGHYEGEPIDLNGSIWMKKQGDSSYDLRTVIPGNYHYADKNELKNGQIQKEKLTYTNGTITIYVVGNWIDASDQEAPVITHRLNSATGAFVPGLRDIRQGGRYGDPVMINVKDPIHRSRKYDPKKYCDVNDNRTSFIPSNGLIQTSFGKPIIIIYGR